MHSRLAAADAGHPVGLAPQIALPVISLWAPDLMFEVD
jgi:hypothetical protein